MGIVRVPAPPPGLVPPDQAVPPPPRGGSGEATARDGGDVGYQPVTDPRVLKLEKEVVQLQEANNQLTADLHRHRERERLHLTQKEPPNKDEAEDALWEAQSELESARHLLKGWLSSLVISSPGAFILLWGAGGAQNETIQAVLIALGIFFALAAVISVVASFICVFSIAPDAKRGVRRKQRQLDRITYKELGIDQIIQKELRIE